jgi:hypothetical protein
MAEPDRPPGQRSLFDFGVRRVAEKRPPPEVDRAEVENDLEAKRQARKQQDAGGRGRGRAGAWAGAGGRACGRGRAQQAAAQPCGKGERVVVDVTGWRVGG